MTTRTQQCNTVNSGNFLRRLTDQEEANFELSVHISLQKKKPFRNTTPQPEVDRCLYQQRFVVLCRWTFMEVVVRVNLHLYSRQGIVRNEGLNERQKGYPPPSFLANTSNPTTAHCAVVKPTFEYSVFANMLLHSCASCLSFRAKTQNIVQVPTVKKSYT